MLSASTQGLGCLGFVPRPRSTVSQAFLHQSAQELQVWELYSDTPERFQPYRPKQMLSPM